MELITYKTFYKQEQVNALVALLKENGIEYRITQERESLDSLYGDKVFKRQYFVKIRKEDFATVDSLLIDQSRKLLETVEKDHYLFSFTNEELYDVISKPDEWTPLDYVLAQKILADRGQPIDEKKISQLKNERIKELAKPDKKNREWIYAGYLFAFLGGLLGIFIGWHLRTFRKTLPNGERFHEYDADDRNHGKRILILGIVMLFVWLAVIIFGPEHLSIL